MLQVNKDHTTLRWLTRTLYAIKKSLRTVLLIWLTSWRGEFNLQGNSWSQVGVTKIMEIKLTPILTDIKICKAFRNWTSECQLDIQNSHGSMEGHIYSRPLHCLGGVKINRNKGGAKNTWDDEICLVWKWDKRWCIR